ncbi:MAG: excinuclease ABC subunit UvrB [Patescibacteria group bacterium]|nr:excinuclease ABC subunit UvrB [Patescibacteria group bacterium]
MNFELVSSFKPSGDQPQAIEKLMNGLNEGRRHQVLLGVTGSGKTFTMASLIARLNRPALVISHNKTLAAQLAQEYKEFFPKNAVEYFVSYYDYYQPEAYIPSKDQYIEKEADINQEIDRLRLSATASLVSRRDVLVVASVSCIYNLGSPVEYGKSVLSLEAPVSRHSGRSPESDPGRATLARMTETIKRPQPDFVDVDGRSSGLTRERIMKGLVDLFYERADFDFKRSTFRVRGEVIDVWPAWETDALRLEFDDNNFLKTINKISPLTGQVIDSLDKTIIYPAKHYISDRTTYEKVFAQIREDLRLRINDLKKDGRELEAHRLKQRTEYDLETIKTLGFCPGIENYSRYFDGRKPGDPPYTLLDYFDVLREWLLIIDESHITVPQIRGMYRGDRARKETLIDYGFRLPSAADNRPLRFDEFLRKIPQTIYTSATPEEWEISMSKNNAVSVVSNPSSVILSEAKDLYSIDSSGRPPQNDGGIVEQLIRPTGLLDPEVEVRPSKGQIDDLIKEIENRVKKRERTLVTTLTKRFAEELSDFLEERGIKVNYLHSDVATLERTDILDDLRQGRYDVVVGINLLREGLDLPEVSLVAILDADKEGFLRSKTSLIQTMGRASRHIHGRVIMYADGITESMKQAIDEVKRRRQIQLRYNQLNRVTPQSIQKPIRKRLIEKTEEAKKHEPLEKVDFKELTPGELTEYLKDLQSAMSEAAGYLDFELAARYRDRIRTIKKEIIH